MVARVERRSVLRLVRRSLVVVGLTFVVFPLAITVASGQAADATVTYMVKTIVVGSGTPSSVKVSCSFSVVSGSPTRFINFTLNFDADGAPTTAVPNGWEVVDGGWVLDQDVNSGGVCYFTESAMDSASSGAPSTGFTCGYTSNPVSPPVQPQPSPLGCNPGEGSGVGPVLTNAGDGSFGDQTVTVTFTNTFTAPPVQPIQPPAAVVEQPVLTG
jgi:hypothetical protein